MVFPPDYQPAADYAEMTVQIKAPGKRAVEQFEPEFALIPVSQALPKSLALNQPQNTCFECILARIGASSFRKILK
jgi:hypothetical protein